MRVFRSPTTRMSSVTSPSSSITAEEETPAVAEETQTTAAAVMASSPPQRDFPPGYRFVPTDEELILQYLKPKMNNEPIPNTEISDVKLYKHNPQFLSETYPRIGETGWYFFTSRDRKYRNGSRPNRSAGNGYWKATGADRMVTDAENNCVGFRKALVFYEGKPPNGNKTNWIMHEYRLDLPPRNRTNPEDMLLDDWVLCRIYAKPARQNQHPRHQEDDANAVAAGVSAGDDHNAAPVDDNIPENVKNPGAAGLNGIPENVDDYEALMAQDSSFHEYQSFLMDPCMSLAAIGDDHSYDFGMSSLSDLLGLKPDWGFQQDYNSNWGVQNSHVTTAAASASAFPSTSAFVDSFIKSEDDEQAWKRRRF